MPTLSLFYGIAIVMYWREHPPPHFHAKSAGRVMVVHIETLHVEHNSLPPNKAKLVLQWASEHRAELMEAWEQCRQRQEPNSIEPLR